MQRPPNTGVPLHFARRLFPALAIAVAIIGSFGSAGSLLAAESADDKPGSPGSAQTAPPEPAYESNLIRLAQVLGSVDYLRKLCVSGETGDWRARMQALLDSEASGEPERIRRLTASFNRGYRAFAAVYTTCTPAAVAAEERYRHEGATLAREIVAKYGN